MDKEIRKPYLFDMLVVSGFLVLTWGVLIFTVHEIMPLASTPALRGVIALSAGLAAVFATASLVAVMTHLRRRRESIYREDQSPCVCPPSGADRG